MSNKKKLIVSDASSLILLAKTNLIGTVIELFDMRISERVFKETVISGKKRQREDAHIIEANINMGHIQVIKTKYDKEVRHIAKSFNLGRGEEESIILYLQLKADLLLIDDRGGIKTSKILKLNWATVPNLLPLLIKLNRINKERALDVLAKLQIYGRYKLNYILEIEGRIKK